MTATAAGHSSLMRRITLATGVELAVHQLGDGEPVLLLHAWGETHRSFDRLVSLLPRTLHLVVPDQRGVGDSAKPAHGYALHDAVGDVIALLDALGLDASWLVGTSSGGYLAQQVTVDYPDRVRGLVLIGAPSNLHQASPGSFLDLLSSFHDPVTRGDIDALNGALPLHSPVPAAFLDDQMTAALTIPKSVWSAAIQGLLAAPPPIQSGPITVRTLILSGAEEDVLPADQANELAAAIAGSRLVTYEGTGHLVLWEQPERVAADVTAFITRPHPRAAQALSTALAYLDDFAARIDDPKLRDGFLNQVWTLCESSDPIRWMHCCASERSEATGVQ